MVKQFYLANYWNPNRCSHSGSDEELRVIETKEYCPLPRTVGLERHNQDTRC